MISLQARTGFEGAARLAKVLRLVAVIDEATPDGTPPARVAEILEGWQPSDWARAGICAGIHPPSGVTQAVVVDYYRKKGGAR